jgi:hypothetical protein
MQRYYMVVLSVEILKACLKSVFHGKWVFGRSQRNVGRKWKEVLN